MNKKSKNIIERIQDIKDWNEKTGHPIEYLLLICLTIIGFLVNAQICAVEDVMFPLIIYCGIILFLLKFGDRFQIKTVVKIIFGLLIFSYLLLILAMPEMVHLNIKF